MINARSVVNKMDELHQITATEDPDLIMITETWATYNLTDAELKLENYEMLRLDRRIARGGGCIIHFKSFLNVTLEEQLTGSLQTESLYCKLKGPHSEVLIGIIYNSTANTEEEEENIHHVIRRACLNYRDVILTGDFNHRTINWETLHSDREGQPFLDLTQDCFLAQCVEEPTRGENILDLVLTTNDNLLENVTVREPLGSSDHNMVQFEVAIHTDPELWKTTYVDYRHGRYRKMRTYLKEVKWTEELNKGPTIEAKWNIFKRYLETAVNKFVPTKTRKKKRQPQWWNKEIDRTRKQKIRWWNQYKNTKSDADYRLYKSALNRNNKEVRKAKMMLEKKLANNIKSDPKAYYKYVRSKTEAKEKVGPLKENGVTITDDKKSAELLNQYFASVFTIEETSYIPNPPVIYDGPENHTLLHIEITSDMVLKKLQKLKPNKSPGVDNIYPVVLKHTAASIAQPLSHIFQESLNKNEIPSDWRNANVTPIYKKGPKHQPENYRPVSLTSQISKVMESILKDFINIHLDKFHLIKETQHGFTKGKSCLSNLLTFLEDVTRDIDSGRPVDILYLDFSKAFDRVPHIRLDKKIRAHGITGNVADWIATWLSGRKQKVVISGKSSAWKDVVSGVPQGSVLGPTLFLIYINDIDINISSTILKFADDTKVYRSTATPHDIQMLQQDLCQLYKWSTDWQMLFNVQKCKSLHIGHSNVHHSYHMNNIPIESTSSEKDLGIIIQSDLKVSQQVAKAVKSANRALGIIRRNITDKSKFNIIRLYKSLVRPHLEYGVQAWRPYLQRDINNIEKIQRRATKMIRGLENLPYERRLQEVNLISLERRRLRADLIQVFKIMNGLEAIPKEKLFELLPASRNTRGHQQRIFKQRVRLDSRKYFFSQRIIDEWNNLPIEAITATTINQFKRAIDPVMKRNGGQFISQRRLPAPTSRPTGDRQ